MNGKYDGNSELRGAFEAGFAAALRYTDGLTGDDVCPWTVHQWLVNVRPDPLSPARAFADGWESALSGEGVPDE